MRSLLARTVLAGSGFLIFLPTALPQLANGTFVAPVRDAPFTAVSRLETTRITPEGASIRLKTIRPMARDSQGRIYKEARKLESASETTTPPILMIALYEPQTKLYTYIYPPDRTFWKGTLKQPASLLAREYFYGWPTRYGPALSKDTRVEDLGQRTMLGLPVQGVRQTRSVAAEGKNLVETDEYWYSDDLGMNLLAIHHEPNVTVTVTVIELKRAEPDPSLFRIPVGYQRQDAPFQ
jgi:hypothetical protein